MNVSNVSPLFDYLFKILEGGVKSSFEKLYLVSSKDSKEFAGGFKFFPEFYNRGILGLPEVINGIVEALEAAKNIYEKDGRIMFMYFYGPTGSGKSYIGKVLENLMERALYEYPAYRLVLYEGGGKKKKIKDICQFNEEPLGLFSSKKTLLPYDLKRKLRKFYKGEVCNGCSSVFNSIFIGRDIEFSEEIDYSKSFEKDIKKDKENYLFTELELDEKDIKLLKRYLSASSNKLYVAQHLPTFLNLDLANDEILENVANILKESNRGIIYINLDNLSDFKEKNIQFLLRISDACVTFPDGSSVSLDLIPVIHSNENLFEKIYNRNEVLKRRIVKAIPVRRLLSVRLESNLIKKFNLPFKHSAPNSYLFYSIFIVGSRINLSGETYEKEKDLRELLDIYDRYENYEKLTDKEFEMIKRRILKEIPDDGWSEGFSFDEGLSILFSHWFKSRFNCFTYEEVLKSIENYRYRYLLQYDFVNKKILETSFKDVVISLICAIENINPENIEKEFDLLVDVVKKKIYGEREVQTVYGVRSVDEEIKRISKRLLVYDKERLYEIIKSYLLDENFKEKLTFKTILDKNPEIIIANETVKGYIDWNLDPEKMVGLQKDRLDSLIEKMKLLGYCRECAISAIKIAKKKIVA